MDDSRLDDVFKKRLQNPQKEPYDPSAWKALQPRLNAVHLASLYALRRRLWVAWAGLGCLLLLNGFLWYRSYERGDSLKNLQEQMAHLQQDFSTQLSLAQSRTDTLYYYFFTSGNAEERGWEQLSSAQALSKEEALAMLAHTHQSAGQYQPVNPSRSRPFSQILSERGQAEEEGDELGINQEITTHEEEGRGEEMIGGRPQEVIAGADSLAEEEKLTADFHVETQIEKTEEKSQQQDIVEPENLTATVVDSAEASLTTQPAKPAKTKVVAKAIRSFFQQPPVNVAARVGGLQTGISGGEGAFTLSPGLDVGLRLGERWTLYSGVSYLQHFYELKELTELSQDQLALFPELLQNPAFEGLKEIKSRRSMFQIPLALEYQLPVLENFAPYVRLGWVSQYSFRQVFTYEFDTTDGESEIDVDPVRPGWQTGSLQLGLGFSLYQQGAWDVRVGGLYQQALLPQGQEQLLTRVFGGQVQVVYHLGEN